jgi:hypothetical protein
MRGFGRVYRPKYTSRVDAVRLLKRRNDEMGRGKLIGPIADRISFNDLKQMLEWDYKANGRKSLYRARVALKALESRFGFHRALDITTDRIMQYVTTRQEAPVKPATINYELSILKRMFTLAIQAEKLDRKPHVPKIEMHNVRQGFFSLEQFYSVLSFMPESVKPLVEMLWISGWRQRGHGPSVETGGLEHHVPAAGGWKHEKRRRKNHSFLQIRRARGFAAATASLYRRGSGD